MLDLSLLSMCLGFVALGFIAPFVWSLAYIWVDVLVPHHVSHGMLQSVPLAFIMGAGAVFSYLLFDRRSPPRISLVHVLCVLIAIWITLTTTWAVVPDSAWSKWDPSFKVLVFAVFMPFAFRSRVHIEAYLLVFILAAAGHLLPWGVKTLLGGGGYNQSLGLLDVNATILAESSSVATVGIMFVPFLIWMRNHSLLIPWRSARTALAATLVMFYLIATIGTFARTGLIGLVVLGAGLLARSRRKLVFLVLALIVGAVLFAVTSDKWTARMDTIGDYSQESSALVRLLVWKWTIGFAADHPFGGGFNSFLTNVLVMPPGPDGLPGYQYGRAFHSIWFAALGEHGYPGLALYVAIMLLSLLNMQRIVRKCRGRPDLLWASDLAKAAQLGLLVVMVCGNFVDLSFLFVIWDVVALMLCLDAHVHRALGAVPVASPARMRAARVPIAAAPASPRVAGQAP